MRSHDTKTLSEAEGAVGTERAKPNAQADVQPAHDAAVGVERAKPNVQARAQPPHDAQFVDKALFPKAPAHEQPEPDPESKTEPAQSSTNVEPPPRRAEGE